MRIKAVIMSHDCPENVDELYAKLSPVFDDVEVFDSGSSSDKIPKSLSRSFRNIYWTGLWEEVRKTCSDYDAVWVLGGDVKLNDEPEKYRKSIEESLPFGCWSPSIEGRAKPYMQKKSFEGMKRNVWNIEGIAMAVSGDMLRKMGEFPAGNPFGYGQDLWLCWRARWLDLASMIDGGVSLTHPEGTGYSDEEAGRQMEATFTGLFGKNWRTEAFHYSDYFEENVLDWPPKQGGAKDFLVATVENGWGLADFLRIVGKMGGTRGVVVTKGVLAFQGEGNIGSAPYEDIDKVIKTADAFLFTRVGEANKEDYERILKAGIPVVAHKAFDQGMIEHQETGYVYYDDAWALKWLVEIRSYPERRKELDRKWKKKLAQPQEKPVSDVPKVSVITPTYKRDPKVISRCVSCMLLQTKKNWEQIICSDGEMEEGAKSVVEAVSDSRVRYAFTTGKKEGDFGNTVRSEMLKEAKGKYVLFLDDDNLIMPDYLEKMVARLESSPDCAFAVCNVMHFGPLNESVTGKPPQVLKGEPVKLYHVDPLQVLVKREAMLEVGWDTEVGYLSDGVTLEKLGERFKHVRVDEVLGVHI